MARKVYITDDMGLDDGLVTVADTDTSIAMMWPWFIPAFDDWGRAEANARRLKGKIFPIFDHITVDTVETAILQFAKVGLIALYEVNGCRYMAIPPDKWFHFQSHIRSEKREKDESKYPPIPRDSDKNRAPDSDNREPARECAETREDARDSAQNCASVTVTVTPSVTESIVGSKLPTSDESKGSSTDSTTPSDDDGTFSKRQVPLPKHKGQDLRWLYTHYPNPSNPKKCAELWTQRRYSDEEISSMRSQIEPYLTADGKLKSEYVPIRSMFPALEVYLNQDRTERVDPFPAVTNEMRRRGRASPGQQVGVSSLPSKSVLIADPQPMSFRSNAA